MGIQLPIQPGSDVDPILGSSYIIKLTCAPLFAMMCGVVSNFYYGGLYYITNLLLYKHVTFTDGSTETVSSH